MANYRHLDLNQYLTTKEVCELLRLKERKIYELVNNHQIPFLKVTGRLLFPKDQIDQWLKAGFHAPREAQVSSSTIGQEPDTDRANVISGSHCPLLEWAIRESQCGLATRLDGSIDGLDVFQARQSVATGLHLQDEASDQWNIAEVRTRFAQANVVLLHWASRTQGLIMKQGNPLQIKTLRDLQGVRVAIRPKGSGAYKALVELLKHENLNLESLEVTATCHTESDSVIAVLTGQADVALGLEALANQFQADFIGLRHEEVDILVDRKAWFDQALQTLFQFTQSVEFQRKAREFKGYSLSNQWSVKWNSKV